MVSQFKTLSFLRRLKMSHAYYQYNKEQLLKNPRLPLICMPDNATVFQAMAKEMFQAIEENNQAGKKTVFICPVGPVGQYPYFVDMVNEKNLSLKDTWFINMDEYLDDDKKMDSSGSPVKLPWLHGTDCLYEDQAGIIMPEEQRVFPDPDNVGYIPELIEKLGGVDIAFGGIGINGHVAFNEADPSLTPEEISGAENEGSGYHTGDADGQRHR